MLVVNIDMANNVVVAMVVEVVVAVVDWKTTVLIGRWTVQNAEQVQLDTNDECDEPDEDGSSYLLRATTLMLLT